MRDGRQGNGEYMVSLDIARGFAALAVVLWHWQHFFFNGAIPGDIERHRQPRYDFLFLFYERGWMAVDFFFVLSGFIFYSVYSRSVAEGCVTGREFFILRLSRLYPLHFVTLVLVAILQWVVLQVDGHSFVYQFNDTYHFILNLFFASAWGLQKGFSFNAPIWSVSVEVLLYGLFFGLMRLFGVRVWPAVVLAGVGFFVQVSSELIGRGLFAFYIGGLTFFVFRWLIEKELVVVWSWTLAGCGLAFWVVTIIEFKTAMLFMLVQGSSAERLLGKQGVSLWMVGLVMPLSILALAMLERCIGEAKFQWGAWMGKVSYSSYLLHFPLQLIFFATASLLGLSRNIFYSPYLWLGYFIVLICMSLSVHKFLEVPLQQLIRRNLLGVRSSRIAPAA